FHVTGVQTCALPIFALVGTCRIGLRLASACLAGRGFAGRCFIRVLLARIRLAGFWLVGAGLIAILLLSCLFSGTGIAPAFRGPRSEERRVGKERRPR